MDRCGWFVEQLECGVDARHVNDERVGRGTTLDEKDPANGIVVRCIRTEPVHGLRRQTDESTVAQGGDAAGDARRIRINDHGAASSASSVDAVPGEEIEQSIDERETLRRSKMIDTG